MDSCNLDICILPISGGGFPVQVGSCCLLGDVQYVPDVVLASSGGSLAAYLMAAGEWTPKKVPIILEQVTSKMFARKWSMPIFNHLYSLSQGSIFDRGSGGDELLSKLFDCKKIQYHTISIHSIRIPIY